MVMKNLSFRVGMALMALVILALVAFGGWHFFQRQTERLGIRQVDFSGLRGAPVKRAVAAKLNKPADLLQKATEARQKVRAGLRHPEVTRQQIARAIQDKFAVLTASRPGPPPPPLHGQTRGYGRKVLDPDQQQALDELYALLGEGAQLQVDQVAGTVRHLCGDLRKAVEPSASFRSAKEQGDYPQMAVATLTAVSRAMNIRNPALEFTAQTPRHDELNMVHVKLDQQCNALPVWGAQVIVHFDAAGNPTQIQGVYAPTPARFEKPAQAISEQAAVAVAERAVTAAGPGWRAPKVTQKFYWEPNVSPILAYQVDLVPSLNESWRVFVAVAGGSVLHVISDSCSGAVRGQGQDLQGHALPVAVWQDGKTYLAIDTTLAMYDATRSHPPNFTNMFGVVAVLDLQNQRQDYTKALQAGAAYASSSSANQWDPTVVSVLNHFSRIDQYYRTTHHRNSFDDQGISLVGLVHCLTKNENGTLTKDNAFYNPALQLLGFGDGENIFGAGQLPAALDVVGHEYTHGVVFSTANLAYENQSGALNEHLADYFGCMVARSNWWIGADACVGTSKKMLRDMANPLNAQALWRQPKTMAEYVNQPNTPQGDYGGVHENSGILNYASYLFTGGPQGLGREKGERIVYRALTSYLTQYSQFIDYRRAVLSAAHDLFPDGSTTNAIVQAFDAVGILEDNATTLPTPVTATSGEEQILFLRNEYSRSGSFRGYGLYLLTAQASATVASRYLDRARPSVSGDGQWALYIGTDENIYWTDGVHEQAWTRTMNVRSIAMTPDQRYIAFTTTDYDNTITILDTSSNTSVEATLVVPTTGAGNSTDLGYADVLTFNCTGDTLVFDACTEATIAQSVSGTWGLYGLRIKDRVCFTLLPPRPGLDIGNPSMAHTLPYTLVADAYYTTNQQTTFGIVSLDLVNHRVSVLTNKLNVCPNPTFRSDDQKIVFAAQDNSRLYHLYEATLTADRTALAAAPVNDLCWSENLLSYPVGFRTGPYTPAAGKLSISPGSLDFGSITIGQAAIKSLILTNSGNADLELIGATFEGTATNVYDFASALQKRMAVGQSQALKLKFQPDQTGQRTVNLRFQTTAPNQPDTLVRLSGTGVPTGTATGTKLTVVRAANGIQLIWTGDGTLELADQVIGPWTAVIGAASPQTIAITGARKFYRLRLQ